MAKWILKKQLEEQWLYRFLTTLFIFGQVWMRILQRRIHRDNLLEQLAIVGWGSLLAVVLINTFTGVLFTIQTTRELSQFGAKSLVGGAFALGYCRELAPVLTAGLLVGEVSSAFAAEIGEMRVTDQIDALYILHTDPIDYLVVPRVLSCCLMLPVLTVLAIGGAMLGGTLAGAKIYGIPPTVFLNSIQAVLEVGDLCGIVLKAFIFGIITGLVGCGWGLTTTGGAKGVSKSTKAAVVNGWILVFFANFVLTIWLT
uniref:ABC transporter permease n=1 Tax=Cyanothece sp. (strain PCC 7425 / ATCC 29141) TaxID=395961 RepID=B8HX45_CYAP4